MSGRFAAIEWLTLLTQRHKIHQDLLIRLQKANTMEEIGVVLAEIQKMFGFRWYYVLDTSRLAEKEPVSFIFPSNIAASFFRQLEEFLVDYVSLFVNATDALGPSRCDLVETLAKGGMTQEVADLFRASSMLRGATFPARDISGAPRLIGFSGDRPHLDVDEIEELNILAFHAHAQLTMIGRNRTDRRQPLSGLERRVLALISDGACFDTIAVKMGLSSRTISYLIDSICRKMEVTTIEHAVAVTLRRGMVL